MSESMSEIISAIDAGKDLSRDQARSVFEQIMTGQVEPDTIGVFLKALAAKGETVDEVAGAADVMNEKVTPVSCEADCIDTCGTGGDGISTFNVSTTAALIAAAAGATVAKHGNRTHTRVSGSAEAIAALGVNLDAPVPVLERCLRDCRIAFLYAPNLHPAMRYAGPVRKKLGIRTIFNLLGPLTNPAGAKRQVLGTSKPEHTELLAQVLASRGAAHAWVVNAHNGLCDLTITGPTRVTEVRDGRVRTFTMEPGDVGFEPAELSSLLVNTPDASAAAIRAILSGNDRGARRQHALLNAAAALVVAGVSEDLQTGVDRAAEAVDSGAAEATLARLVETAKG
jgi:anthranilate phosphoribosyltransferase